MAKIRYACDDCSHEFNGNDFTDECPNCGSRNIEPSSDNPGGGISSGLSRLFVFINNNKVVFGLILIGLIVLLVFSKKEVESNVEYSITISQPNGANYLAVGMRRLDETTNKLLEVPSTRILSLIEKKVIINNGDPIDIQDDNRIYLCPRYEGAIRIKITPKPLTKIKGLGVNKKTKVIASNFKLDGILESDKANCPALPLNPSEIEIRFERNCKLRVVVTRDLRGKSVLVSVSGKDGAYEKRLEWDRKSLVEKRQDVWVIIEGNDKATATPAITNGNKIPDCGCPATPEAIKVFIQEFKRLAKNFGLAPRNREAQRAFQSFLTKGELRHKIYLNNESVDIYELMTKMRVNAINDDKRYRLDGEPTLSDSCILTFKFIEIQ
jgi:hypothetical protein